MSQYPTGQMGPTSAVRQRRVSDNDPRVGQTESLGVFGVTPTTAVDDRGVNSARALMAALGVVDRSLAVSAQEVERQRAIAEREAAENERVFRGIGAERTIEVGPQLLEDVRTGKIRPNEGEDYAAFADRIIRERAALPDDDAATPIAIDEMRKRLSTGLQNEAIRLVNEESDRQRKEMSSLIVSGAAGKSADELRAAIAELRTINPDASEEALRDTVATASLQVAALQGNEAAFKEAASLLPENSADVARHSVTLRERLREREGMAINALDSRIAGMYVDEQPFSAIRESIASARGSVPDEVIERKLRELDDRKARVGREAMEALLDQYNRDQADAVLQADTTAALTAFSSGGIARIDGDYEWTDPSGKPQKITRDERIESAVSGAFAAIDKEGGTPAETFAKKMNVLGTNGATYKPWSRVMEAGTSSVFQAVRVQTKPGEDVKLPANAVDGFNLWKQMNATNDGVLQMHVPSQTNDLYWLASLAEKQGRDPAQSLILAATAQSRTPFGTLSDEMVVKNDDWFMEGENAQQIGSLIAGTARLAVGAGLASPEQAIKDASRQIKASHRNINGSWIDIRNRAIPPTFEKDANYIIDEWMRAHGKETDTPRSRLTMMPAPTGAGWWMMDKRTNLPVDTDWFVSDADLARAGTRRLDSIRGSIANSPFREVRAVVKKTATDAALNQMFGSPEARTMMSRAANEAGDAIASVQIPGTNIPVGEIGSRGNDAVNRMKLSAAVSIGGGAGRAIAGVTSWLNRRPGESEAAYIARTGRKP